MGRSERRGELFASLVLGLRVLVPYDDRTLTAKRCESVELLIKGDSIDRVDLRLGRRFCLLPMALEAKIETLTLVMLARVVVFDTAAALNRADSIAFSVPKDTDGSRCELER